MIRHVIASLALCVLSVAAAAAPAAHSRTTLTPSADIWVGQKVTLVVELLVPGYFASSPSFDLPSVAGLLLLPPIDRPVVSSEDADGVTYTVQRHELMIFARQAGSFDIPAFNIRFGYKTSPLDHDEIAQAVTTNALHFDAKLPPGAEGLATLISARSLTAEEHWQPEIGKAKAGDAFTRTITLSADDVPGMAFPPFVAAPIDGMSLYAKDPEVLDHSERGVLQGKRRETVTYVCERAGRFVIPAAHFTWWNLEEKRLETVDFPEHVLVVAANPSLSSQSAWWRHIDIRTAAKILGALLVLSLLATRLPRMWRATAAYFRARHLVPLNPS